MKRILYTIKPKLTLYLTVLLLVIVTAVFYFDNQRNEISLFPSDQYQWYTYNDAVDNGNSTIEGIVENDILKISYTPKEQFAHPYVGIVFSKSKPFDLSNFDVIKIKLKSQESLHLISYLMTEDDAVVNKDHRLAARHSEHFLTTEKGEQEYTLNISDYVTPKWWFEAMGQDPSEFDAINLKTVNAFSISTGVISKLNQTRSFEIESIVVIQNTTFEVYQYVITIIMGLALIPFSQLLFFDKKSKSIRVEYKAIDHPQNPSKNENELVIRYIGEHYTEAQLSLAMVSKNTGVSEREISRIIKEQLGYSFKAYINKMRIEESTRLLQKGELSISEVAYLTGFNSPSTFSKVFKKEIGQSPTEYLQGFES